MSQRLPGPDLTAIAAAASREAGGVPVGLLGDYLPAAAEAAASGRRLTATVPGTCGTGAPGSPIAGARQFMASHFSQPGTMTGHARQSDSGLMAGRP